MGYSTIVLMIIFAFTFVPLVLAEFARNKFKYTLEDFYLQSRSMTGSVAFFTIYATWVSSFAFLGSTNSFYTQGPLYMTSFAWNILFAVIFFIIGRRIWFYGKTRGYMTATDFFDDIYGNKVLSFTVTLVLTLFTVPYLAIQLHGGAFLIETASNGAIPYSVAGLVFYMIIVIYLWSGGLRAVAFADIFYGILIFISMVGTGVVFAIKAKAADISFAAVGEMYGHQFHQLGDFASSNSPLVWLAMFVVIPAGAIMGPPMWLRTYSIKDSKIFKALPFFLSFGAIMYIGPMVAANYAKGMFTDSGYTDNLMIVIILRSMPTLMATLIFCGIAAASLSTANSQIHALSSIFTLDIHTKFAKEEINERQSLKVAQWSVLVISVIGYILMLWFNFGIINMGVLSFLGTSQILVPVIGALFWKKSNSNAAAIGIWLGIIVSIVLGLILKFDLVLAAFIGLLLNTAVFIFFSSVMKTETAVAGRISAYREEFVNGIERD